MITKIIFLFVFFLNVNIFECKSNPLVFVKTSSGVVKGQTIKVLSQRLNQFYGIPFAEPPIGSLRFAKPEPIRTPLKGVIDGLRKKSACYQIGLDIPISESCLYLNIWSQTSNEYSLKHKPVMVYIHGLGLTQGTGFTYPGRALAVNGVVVVTINYRLNAFGFLYGGDPSAPGNVGLYDQIMAIKWVRDNIYKFGGDKNQITIIGEAAGSWCVSGLILSPQSRGLFQRAIIESGATFYNPNRFPLIPGEALNLTKQLAQTVNCPLNSQMLSCLRQVSPNRLSTEFNPSGGLMVWGTEFLPLKPQNAFNHGQYQKGLDIIAGVNNNEGYLTTLSYGIPDIFYRKATIDDFRTLIDIDDQRYHNLNKIADKIIGFYLANTGPVYWSDPILAAISRFAGEFGLACPTYFFGKTYAEKSTNQSSVYFYQLTHHFKLPFGVGDEPIVRYMLDWFGVYHQTIITFIFGQPVTDPGFAKPDITFSKQVIKWWTNLVKFGNPGNNWKPLISNDNKFGYLIKNLNPFKTNKYFTNLFNNTCDGFWKKSTQEGLL